MPLSTDRMVPVYASNELIDLALDDNVEIVKGHFVGRNRATGYVRALAAGDDFVGLAYAGADNTLDGHVAGGVNVRLWQHVDVTLTISGATLGDVGRSVFAGDSTLATFTTTASRIGRAVAYEGGDLVRVRLTPVGSSAQSENIPFVALSDATQTLTMDHMFKVLTIQNAGARTLTLPPAATVRAGGWFRLIKMNSAAFAVTLDPNLTETIDGASTYAGIDAQYDTALVLCTGSEWVIASRDIA
ncbi:MAG: hypothetical protein JNG88_03395 [Phycisphaerales bacterium]|nr:hypothetical protein [Phycisphaerales bacterium]